jgi:hypothetical protein
VLSGVSLQQRVAGVVLGYELGAYPVRNRYSSSV